MIRKMIEADKDSYLTLATEFYNSSAVLHSIPTENFVKTFDAITAKNPYVAGYFIYYNNTVAGYAILAITFSCEAGGEVIWLEELYIKDTFRGLGLGTEFFKFIDAEYGEKCARLRLEVDFDNDKAIKLYERMGYKFLDYRQMYKEI